MCVCVCACMRACVSTLTVGFTKLASRSCRLVSLAVIQQVEHLVEESSL